MSKELIHSIEVKASPALISLLREWLPCPVPDKCDVFIRWTFRPLRGQRWPLEQCFTHYNQDITPCLLSAEPFHTLQLWVIRFQIQDHFKWVWMLSVYAWWTLKHILGIRTKNNYKLIILTPCWGLLLISHPKRRAWMCSGVCALLYDCVTWWQVIQRESWKSHFVHVVQTAVWSERVRVASGTYTLCKT